MKTGNTNASGDFDQFNTGGFELARGDTTTRDSLTPQLGMVRYNTDIKRPEVYTNQGWKKLLIDSDLGSGTVEDAIGAKLRAAKKMDTATFMFQQGSGTPGAPRVSSSSGSQPSWISHIDNGPGFEEKVSGRWTWPPVYKTYRVRSNFYNKSTNRGSNYFFYKITPEHQDLYQRSWGWRSYRNNLPLKSIYYSGEYTVDIFKMLGLTGKRWDYVYTTFGGVACISGQIMRNHEIVNETKWWNAHSVSPDLTSSKDTDPNYGKVILSMKYGCAGMYNHTSGFSFYFTGRKFKNF